MIHNPNSSITGARALPAVRTASLVTTSRGRCSATSREVRSSNATPIAEANRMNSSTSVSMPR
jgi:hypothetical protein